MRTRDPVKVKAQNAKHYEKYGEKMKASMRAYYIANREVRLAKAKENYIKAKDLRASDPEVMLAYKFRTRKSGNKYKKDRKAADPNFKLRIILRSRLLSAIKRNVRSGSAIEMLGCSVGSFKIYIERKWTDGMSWQNFGLGGWELDHIMPCVSFDLSKDEHQRRCFHFSNFQPLWAPDNRRKSGKIQEEA